MSETDATAYSERGDENAVCHYMRVAGRRFSHRTVIAAQKGGLRWRTAYHDLAGAEGDFRSDRDDTHYGEFKHTRTSMRDL